MPSTTQPKISEAQGNKSDTDRRSATVPEIHGSMERQLKDIKKIGLQKNPLANPKRKQVNAADSDVIQSTHRPRASWFQNRLNKVRNEIKKEMLAKLPRVTKNH